MSGKASTVKKWVTHGEKPPGQNEQMQPDSSDSMERTRPSSALFCSLKADSCQERETNQKNLIWLLFFQAEGKGGDEFCTSQLARRTDGEILNCESVQSRAGRGFVLTRQEADWVGPPRSF